MSWLASFAVFLSLGLTQNSAPTTKPSTSHKKNQVQYILEGQIVGSKGTPVTGTIVKSRELHLPERSTDAILNEQGRFRITYKKNGLYELYIQAPGHRINKVRVALFGQKLTQVCVHLKSHDAPKSKTLSITHVHWGKHRAGLFDKLLRFTAHFRKLVEHMKERHPSIPFHTLRGSEWKAMQQRLSQLKRMLPPKKNILHQLHKLLTLHLASIYPLHAKSQMLFKWSKHFPSSHLLWAADFRLSLMTLRQWPLAERLRMLNKLAKLHPNKGLQVRMAPILIAYHAKQLRKEYKQVDTWKASPKGKLGASLAKHQAQIKHITAIIKGWRKHLEKLRQILPGQRVNNAIQIAKWFEQIKSPKEKRLPGLSLKLFDPSRTFSQASLRGHFTLLLFWATWCDACVAKMPAVHDIYKTYKSYGLQMVSISYDNERSSIRVFRKKKWPMPWLHSIAKGGFDSQIGTKLKIDIIPAQFLLAPNGAILASGPQFRNERFLPTLTRWLNLGYRNQKLLKLLDL